MVFRFFCFLFSLSFFQTKHINRCRIKAWTNKKKKKNGSLKIRGVFHDNCVQQKLYIILYRRIKCFVPNLFCHDFQIECDIVRTSCVMETGVTSIRAYCLLFLICDGWHVCVSVYHTYGAWHTEAVFNNFNNSMETRTTSSISLYPWTYSIPLL